MESARVNGLDVRVPEISVNRNAKPSSLGDYRPVSAMVGRATGRV